MTAASQKELGQTEDPKELIPGDEVAVRTYAEQWTEWNKALESTSQTLTRPSKEAMVCGVS